MKCVRNGLTHVFQTAEVSCDYTALAMHLSYYGSAWLVSAASSINGARVASTLPNAAVVGR